LHYHEAIAEQATAELVARKEEIPDKSTNDVA
jgi:hypothetical protein